MMLAARGIFLAARRKPRLPYDAEVEYLQTIGDAYIDTGLPIVDNTGYQAEVEFRFVNFTVGTFSEDWVFGYWNYQPSPRLYLIGRYANYIRGGAGPDNSTYHAQMIRDTNKHKIALMNDGAYLDGVYKVPTKLKELADPIYGVVNVLLGKSPHVDNGSTRQIYSCKMWAIDGTTLRDFIPVRFTNEQGVSEGAMYDRANPTVGMNPDGSPRADGLYRNRGTGAFGIGADK